ncbi:MAG TPA: hypothetical protein VFV87_09280 [Pirellulaceae bacterium]|nr:hypothetical protein [Pirellulaceae bacterium]
MLTNWLSSGIFLLFGLRIVAAVDVPPTKPAPAPISWLSDYRDALDRGESSSKMVLIWFVDPEPGWKAADAAFEEAVLEQPEIAGAIQNRFIPVKLPLDARIVRDGQEIVPLQHAAFAEMRGTPGLAIVDMTDPDGPLFRQVVSVYPFRGQYITRERLAALLHLPRGTLTQRTLIFAVRTHPEHPASALSHLSAILARECESHAFHQASITLQGHHNWESRFHKINAQLPAGMVTQEVCAESWTGQSLVEAAGECVHSWRQSPGHWEAVSSRHTLFAYDMKLGANGVWYATGIFARPY